MNQVVLVGNVTDDPQLRYTQSGAALAGFTVAVSHRSKHNGEWQDVNDGFFRCTAWRQVAENAARSLHKGDRVLVVGKLIQRFFETEGQKRTVVEIQVAHVGPDLQFATAHVEKATSEKATAEKQSA
ncbi:MAG: single-stranded DNA-binding protein [Actinobacteria bacterium]|nr:single-stranded DNA-binding protein [Actinomycetota bacterium]